MGETERRREAELRRERFELIEKIGATDPEDLHGDLDVRLAELNRLIGD